MPGGGTTKYFPRSKLGAAAAIIYLLFVFFLIGSSIAGDGGLHGYGSMAFLFAYLLALPLSEFALTDGQASRSQEFVSAGILAASAIVNAVLIYLVVSAVSRGLRALLGWSK